jgi:hypothetical protein
MTKRRLVAFAGSLLVLLLTAASCPPQPVNGGGSANTTNTLILIDGSLPLAVALAIQQDPQSEPYFKEAAAAIDLASATNATYAQVQAVIESEGWTNQVAEFAVLDALKLWQAWGSQTGWTNSADSQLILQHIAADIRLGLPPATPNSLRGFTDLARRNGKNAKNGSYAPAPLAHVAHAVSAPFTDPTPPTFGNEIAIGFGGSYTVPQKPDVAPWKQPFNHGTYGLSLQTIYWLNPYFGTGAEANIDDVTRPGAGLFSSGGATVNVRYPLGVFAPYGVLAEDRDWQSGAWDTTARLGLAWRPTGSLEWFMDAGYQWRQGEPDNALILRTGINLLTK